MRQSLSKKDILDQIRQVYQEEDNYSKRISSAYKNRSFIMFQLNNQLKNNEKRLQMEQEQRSKHSKANSNLIQLQLQDDEKQDTMHSTRTAWKVETLEEHNSRVNSQSSTHLPKIGLARMSANRDIYRSQDSIKIMSRNNFNKKNLQMSVENPYQ